MSSTQVFDSIFEETGHETIILPPYHCDLDAIQLIWNTVKTRAAQ
jgi:hypothetical protein